LIIRHPSSGAAEFASNIVHIPVINAGDGRHEHPTQGLLDLLTIWENKIKPGYNGNSSFSADAFDFSGLTIAIVGDIAHSRVARSDVWGLTKLGAKVRWVGPRTLMPADASQMPVTVHTELAEGMEDADVVIVLRLQTERQERGLLPSLREYSRIWGVNSRVLKCAHPDVLVMHPGPINRGVEIASDVADGLVGIHSAIEEQVTNGVAVRMACLYLLLGGDTTGEG
jgi:aspartate carbamoyltransferase catalytic subunit